MRLAISNIAWDVAEDSFMRDLFHRYHIDAIDIAPTKYFPDVVTVGETEVLQVRDWWRHQGIEITGMQSLLFGTTGLNVFGPAAVLIVAGPSKEFSVAGSHIVGRCGAGQSLFEYTVETLFGYILNADRFSRQVYQL